MPIEKSLRKPIEAEWSFTIVDMDRRVVAFKDKSYGTITSRLWDFSDGTTSNEQNPIHTYEKPDLEYVVVFTVSGPSGSSGTARMSKVWDVAVK